MANEREKRLAPRARVGCHVRYRVVPAAKADFRNALARDVSLTGFRFHGQEFVPRRTNFMLEMLLPGNTVLRSLARAVWVRAMPEDDGYDVGGVFVEPTCEARSTLKKFFPEQPQTPAAP